jgi:hypothetical protein
MAIFGYKLRKSPRRSSRYAVVDVRNFRSKISQDIYALIGEIGSPQAQA